MSERRYPKITVVTVNYNLAAYLEETMNSVLSQNYPNLEYIVVDGGSTDGSVEIIQKYADKLAWWVSEQDKGQYDAVQKGFDKSTGEIMYWVNSDDRLYPGALLAVAEIFESFPEVEWIQGRPTEFTPEGSVINRIDLPWGRWSKYRYLTWDFQFIQQEATFWRRSLWEKAGATLTQELKLAGDMELWARFFRHAELYTTSTLLGGFRHRREPDQRSKLQRDLYMQECVQVIRRERALLNMGERIGLFFRRWLALPFMIPFFLNLPLLRLPYIHLFSIPPVISYNFYTYSYILRTQFVRLPPFLFRGRQVARRR